MLLEFFYILTLRVLDAAILQKCLGWRVALSLDLEIAVNDLHASICLDLLSNVEL